MTNELLHIVDVVVEVEFTVFQGHQTRVLPIGNVDLMVTQHGANGVAQQSCVVARQRRDDQHGGLVLQLGQGFGVVRVALETQQFTERFFDLDALMDGHIDPVHIDRSNAKLWLQVVFA